MVNHLKVPNDLDADGQLVGCELLGDAVLLARISQPGSLRAVMRIEVDGVQRLTMSIGNLINLADEGRWADRSARTSSGDAVRQFTVAYVTTNYGL